MLLMWDVVAAAADAAAAAVAIAVAVVATASNRSQTASVRKSTQLADGFSHFPSQPLQS